MRCDRGFQLIGNSRVKCRNGIWSGPVPVCTVLGDCHYHNQCQCHNWHYCHHPAPPCVHTPWWDRLSHHHYNCHLVHRQYHLHQVPAPLLRPQLTDGRFLSEDRGCPLSGSICHHHQFLSRMRLKIKRRAKNNSQLSRFGCNRDFHLLGEKVSWFSWLQHGSILLKMNIMMMSSFKISDEIEDNVQRFPTVLVTLGAMRNCPSVQVSHSLISKIHPLLI